MKITIAKFDDWEGLYINGKLVSQDHKITIKELAAHINLDIELKEVDYDWFEGNFPEDLNEVKFE